MAKESNQVLGHGADADGIEEYDNPLPDWWLGLFIITIIWAVGYTAYYHFISDDSQVKQYNAEMAAAAVLYPESTGPVVLKTDDATLAEGLGVFTQTCESCHKANLTGGIGPNLIDSEWIHGGSPEQVVATITDGVAAKGMPAWGPVLGPKKVQAVAAYILSKQGETPAEAPVQLDEKDGTGSASDGSDDTDGAVADAGDADDPMTAGKAVFTEYCVACHQADMTGLVGPNLIDAEWLHGGELDQIRTTISKGVPAKGMMAWEPVIGAEKVDAVARYVHSKATEAQE
ncbi:MAG: c-type cytochrome [Myxococcota bacterium]